MRYNIKKLFTCCIITISCFFSIVTPAFAANGAIGGIIGDGINTYCTPTGKARQYKDLIATGTETCKLLQDHPELIAYAQEICPKYHVPVAVCLGQACYENGPQVFYNQNENNHNIWGIGPHIHFDSWEEGFACFCVQVSGNHVPEYAQYEANWSGVLENSGSTDRIAMRTEALENQDVDLLLHANAPAYCTSSTEDQYVGNVEALIETYNLMQFNTEESKSSGGSGSCVMNTAGYDGIAQTAVSLAFWDKNLTYPGHEAVDLYNNHDHQYHPATKLLGDKRAEMYPSDTDTADCGCCVATAVKLSGADENYPGRGTGVQLPYCKSHPEIWQQVCEEGTFASIKDELMPGDVLITAQGHTFIYTGNEKIKEQFPDATDDYNCVSGSLDQFGSKIINYTEKTDQRIYCAFRCVNTAKH